MLISIHCEVPGVMVLEPKQYLVRTQRVFITGYEPPLLYHSSSGTPTLCVRVLVARCHIDIELGYP